MIFTNVNLTPQVEANPYSIALIQQDTYPLVHGKNMSVWVQFVCDSNVSAVKIFLFKITEDMLCLCDYVYLTMSKIPSLIRCPTAYRFGANYTVDFPVGMQIGYKIQIFYLNGTIKSVPENENFMGMDTIEPLNNEIMFDAGIVVADTETTDFGTVIIMGLLSYVSIIIFRRNKNKIKRVSNKKNKS